MTARAELLAVAPAFCHFYPGYTWDGLLDLDREVYSHMLAHLNRALAGQG